MKFNIIFLSLLLTACAGMNPNPGERTTDTNWEAGNYSRSLEYARSAARQLEEGKWAEGYIVGATGESGYFGQKNDALIAQYRLADLYYHGVGVEKDLVLSLLIINNTIVKSNGEPQFFFCCDWSGGRWFHQTQFTELKAKIESEITSAQRDKFNNLSASWVLKNDL
ncbi:SEL1-like repeat protein [bacterium AH-315-K03]|nr:SEL1-like repeat protein [bacterium AH-315-K03]